MFGRWMDNGLARFFWRPVLPFALEVLLVAPLTIAPDVPALVPYYLIASPWLLVAFAAINLPLVVLALDRRARLDAPTRRNHALEHATIHFLRRAGHGGLSGRAESGGFRVFGRLTPTDIQAAFAEVSVRVQGRIAIHHISPHCGSNRLTALALGVALLGAVTALSVLFGPPVWVRLAALAAAVVSFYRWRDPVGNWIQERFFMATDFAEVSVRHIRKMRGSNRGGRLSYFVQTRVA